MPPRVLQRQAAAGEINGDPVDRFTVVHGLAGYLSGRLFPRRSLGLAVLAAVAWELAENELKDRYPAYFPHATHDTPANAALDAVAYVGGFALGRAQARRPGASVCAVLTGGRCGTARALHAGAARGGR
jgi:hypothetical protein